MKKTYKCNLLLSILVDFLFVLVGISIIALSVFVLKLMLYPQSSFEGEMRIRTEYMPMEYRDELTVGSVLFDTLTKRRVGDITEVKIEESNGKIRFFITVNSSFKPRSKALRSDRLWFYFAECDV